VKENVPEAEVIMVNRFEGPKGIRVRGEAGFNSMLMVPKTSVKTEERLREVLRFIDFLASEEGQNLLNYGVEGVHYKIVDGYVEWIDQEKFTNETGAGPGIYNLNILLDRRAAAKAASPQLARALKVRKDNENFAVYDPAAPFSSATFAEVGTTLNQIITDARSKFILGEIDESGWQQAVEQWRKTGGDKYIEEINAEYQAAKR
jgi:putative aldouronate transport system substrate-binding protein